ncbi:MAG: AAA family ATPase [Proteobacteria bacterium]|nr:AAA family ATPase [Pseudomonadota bacterium]
MPVLLFIAASPASLGPLAQDEELRAIELGIGSARYRESVTVVGRGAARYQDVVELISREQPGIVHISGHCDSQGHILLAADGGSSTQLSPALLAEVVATLGEHLQLVVLSGCRTETPGEALQAIVNSVVATTGDLTDDAAVAWAGPFYKAIASGASVRRAFDEARLSLKGAWPEQAELLRLLERQVGIATKTDLLRRRTRPSDIQSDASQKIEIGGASTRQLYATNLRPPSGPFVGRDREMKRLAVAFADKQSHVLILTGPPGVGKSELAKRYAQESRDRSPGGVFFVRLDALAPPVDLARVGLAYLNLQFATESLEDQCEATLAQLGQTGQTLLIYDNVEEASALRRWLPALGQACHVVVTTTLEDWPQRDVCRVAPLQDGDALDLVAALIEDPEVVTACGTQLVDNAGGLPIALCPAARNAARAARRGLGRLFPSPLLPAEAESSFLRPWQQLDDDARVFLKVAALFEPSRIPRDLLYQRLGDLDWQPSRCDAALDACWDRSLLKEGPSMHGLIAAFVREQDAPAVPSELLVAHTEAFGAAAERYRDAPGDSSLAEALLSFPFQLPFWQAFGLHHHMDADVIAGALSELGRFGISRAWALSAVEKRQGDIHGRVDHESLGRSLHQVGRCYLETGEYEQARSWYQQAVEEKRQGDVHGRVDHESLGRSLHQVGRCYSEAGEYEQARSWYQQAVEETRQGDVHGRVDHQSLGASLHQVGWCYLETGEYEQARSWYQQAVEEARQGDVHGRVNHDLLGAILQCVGWCYSQTGEYEQARSWYQQAKKIRDAQVGSRALAQQGGD